MESQTQMDGRVIQEVLEAIPWLAQTHPWASLRRRPTIRQSSRDSLTSIPRYYERP
jgi:hypothetical protein